MTAYLLADMSTEEYTLTHTAARSDNDDSSTLSADVLSEIFAHTRTRTLLHSLKACDAPIEIDDLAERVAAEEYGDDAGDHYDRVLVSLYDDHLPLLESVELVRLSADDGVFVAPNSASLGELL